MGRDDYGPISQYNSLTDPYLQGYYSKDNIRSHLKQIGLINRRGEIIPEEIWRKRIATKERMEQASRIIANRIVKQAIEIKRLEKAELRTTMEILAKKELVRRVRGKSVETRNPPKLWPDHSSQRGDQDDRRIFSTMRVDSRRRAGPDDDDEFGVRYNSYGRLPPASKPKGGQRLRRNRSRSTKRRSEFKRSFSAAGLKREPVNIPMTMLYYGKGINIPFDTQVFDSKDEISVYQQHCGGENLLVYSGHVEPGKKFSFVSKRRKEYPFSLSIFINGSYDCRISTCCEFRHRLNTRIGGPTGRFAITSVDGQNTCIKCMLEKSMEQKKKQKRKNQDPKIIVEKNKEYENEFDSEKVEPARKPSVVEIPVREINDSDSEVFGQTKVKTSERDSSSRKSSWSSSSKSSSDDKLKSQRLLKSDVINEINKREETPRSKSPKSSSRSNDFSSSSSSSSGRKSVEDKPESRNRVITQVEIKRTSVVSSRKSSSRSSTEGRKLIPVGNEMAADSDGSSSSDAMKTPKNQSKKSTPVIRSPTKEEAKEQWRNISLSSASSLSKSKNSGRSTPTTPTNKENLKQKTPSPIEKNTTMSALVHSRRSSVMSSRSSDDETIFDTSLNKQNRSGTNSGARNEEAAKLGKLGSPSLSSLSSLSSKSSKSEKKDALGSSRIGLEDSRPSSKSSNRSAKNGAL